jgi:outer membrane protein assembly factor BamB
VTEARGFGQTPLMRRIPLAWFTVSLGTALLGSCGIDSTPLPSLAVPLPAAACNTAPGGGSTTVAVPTLLGDGLADRYNEGWLASPGVADLDGDGTTEIVIARADQLYVFHADGTVVWSEDVSGRIWASPVVADLDPGTPGLEIAVAARDHIYAFRANGAAVAGFPIDTNRDELRSIAAGDIDGDGALEIVCVSTTREEIGDSIDILLAYEINGSPVSGFPPNRNGASGCDETCYTTGGYDQNLALGNIDADPAYEVFATQDNAYLSLHDGDGFAFDANAIFEDRTKFHGVRFLLDYAEAQQGFSEHESTSLQAHFTNSAPAIADLDGDGTRDLIVLGSVQTTDQEHRFKGVTVFAVHPDGTRLTEWIEPYYEPHYLAGLWDFDGVNVVGATNQISVAELFPDRAGPEMVFAGFDGRVHCIDARGDEIWTYAYTGSTRVLTAGIAIADLSGDGRPEIVFASYSPDNGKSELFVVDAGGNELHVLPLPGHGAMAVPTLADVNDDGTLEIVVPLQEQQDRAPMALIYTVAGSAENCMPWPTGRGNMHRDGSAL